MEIIREMQAYYGKRAPFYDSSMGYDDHDTVAMLAPVIRQISNILERRRVLEIACGPCFWTQRVSEVAASDQELMDFFCHYSDRVEITRSPECRRIVVSYIVGKAAGASDCLVDEEQVSDVVFTHL